VRTNCSAISARIAVAEIGASRVTLGRKPAEERVFRPTLRHLADRVATRLRAKSRPGRGSRHRSEVSEANADSHRLAGIGRDVGAATETLHAYLSGARLAPNILETLTKRIWGGALEYDATADRLRSVNKAVPTSIGSPPPPLVRQPLSYKVGAQPLHPGYTAGGHRARPGLSGRRRRKLFANHSEMTTSIISIMATNFVGRRSLR
jgi:hypothetical protein